jgi:hypothetical protein
VADEQEAEGAEGDKKEEPPKELHEFNEYLYPGLKHEVMQKYWGSFTLGTLPIYLMSLFFATYGVDQYADINGTILCAGKKTAAEARGVYGTGIALTVVFHCIEFFRQLIMASGALVGTNLIIPYYVLSINVLFGLVALVMAVVSRFSSDG